MSTWEYLLGFCSLSGRLLGLSEMVEESFKIPWRIHPTTPFQKTSIFLRTCAWGPRPRGMFCVLRVT